MGVDKEILKEVDVKGKINEFEKMKYVSQVNEQKNNAKKTLEDLEKYKEILEARKQKYKSIRNNTKGLKKQFADLKNYCKEFIDLTDWYIDELKKRGIKENIDGLKKSKEEAQHRITEIIEMESERPIKKYGANLDKILTLKSCKSAIADMNDVIKELDEKGDKDAVERAKEVIKEYSSKLQYSRKCLPRDTKEYEEFYKSISNYTVGLGRSLEELKQTIENFKDSSENDNGWISAIKFRLNSITKDYIVKKVIGGLISSMAGFVLNWVVVPSIVCAYDLYSNSNFD